MEITIEDIRKKASAWTGSFFDEATRNEVQELLDHNIEELKESFYKDLEFGTGGMRGTMGVGTNRINKYTLGKNTQGLSNYLKKTYPGEELRVAIAYDCRHNSDTLARVVAEVFAANGIKVFLFSELRATPELSFAVKYLNCHCGVVLTASHNPPEYNGYKVYWTDGGQIVPPQDKEIIEEIESIDFTDIKLDAQEGLIELIDKNVDEAFFNASVKNGSINAEGREDLKIVFTSLHGTSITAIPEVLKRAGYTQVHIVEEQAKPDGDFPTVESPNPEEPEALAMAMEKAEALQADIVIGTDPDSDRLGIAVRDNDGNMTLLNGNQTMILMTRFLLELWKKEGRINGKEFIASTIVSTPMMAKLAEAYGVEYKEGLTGFKWIAKMIKDFPELDFIGGGEESFGYMVGEFVRDKDAVTASLLACEIAAQAKADGSSFYNELLKCYADFGLFKERLVSITKKGISGAQEIKEIMINLRENPVKELAGEKVVRIEDYASSIAYDLKNGKEEKMDIPASNVLIYYTENGTKMAARPSGTEPKIKFYFSANTTVSSTAECPAKEQGLDEKLDAILRQLDLN